MRTRRLRGAEFRTIQRRVLARLAEQLRRNDQEMRDADPSGLSRWPAIVTLDHEHDALEDAVAWVRGMQTVTEMLASPNPLVRMATIHVIGA